MWRGGESPVRSGARSRPVKRPSRARPPPSRLPQAAVLTTTTDIRGNAHQTDDRHPRSPFGKPASVDVTDARNAPQCYPQFELTRWAAEARIDATFPAVRL